MRFIKMDEQIKEQIKEQKNRLKKTDILYNGVIKQNPFFILLLGTCPALAVTTSAINGLGMGAATMAVLLFSNMAISLLKKIIPNQVRIPVFIVLIAGFATMIQLIFHAYFPALHAALGVFIPLIAVNCIILGRAEMFASTHSVPDSIFDGVGMGLGFALALFLMGTIREVLGNGSFMGIDFLHGSFPPMMIFMLAPGGFFVFAILVVFMDKYSKRMKRTKQEFGCDGCPLAETCEKAKEGGSAG
jgi:electron transport complex protein RnfE